jgi:chromosomal replication initiator protein
MRRRHSDRPADVEIGPPETIRRWRPGADVSLARFVVTPETRLAVHAVRRLAAAVVGGRSTISPLVLHGPPGVGKTLLVTGLFQAVSQARPPRTARLLAAADLANDGPPDAARPIPPALEGARQCDLVIVEDVQHLPSRAAGALVRLIDHLKPRRRPVVVTASDGPARLTDLPIRLTNRLTAGLVIGMEPLSAASRRTLLHAMVKQQEFQVGQGVLDWIADTTPGGARPLLGALAKLAMLSGASPLPLDLSTVQSHWADEGASQKPTLEGIAKRVATYYQLDVKSLRGRARQPSSLGPCQVAMYLARELTGQAWPRIGGFFGGRDASTVRHTHAKIAEQLAADAALAAAVRQLRAELV